MMRQSSNVASQYRAATVRERSLRGLARGTFRRSRTPGHGATGHNPLTEGSLRRYCIGVLSGSKARKQESESLPASPLEVGRLRIRTASDTKLTWIAPGSVVKCRPISSWLMVAPGNEEVN